MRKKARPEEGLPSQVPDSPFPSRWLCRDGAELHYVDEGRGTPVLMLHGNPTWAFLYRGVIRRLRHSFRCIAPDLPGFGYSRPPEGYGYTPREHAAWVRLFLEELGIERFMLAGQDWGGPIGLSLAVERPEQVEGLVLANTWCWPPFWDTRAFSLLMGSGSGRWLTRRHNAFPRWILPLGMSRASRQNRSTLQAYIRPFSNPESRLAVPELAKHIRGSADWLAGIEARLSVLNSVPVRLVWGMRDPVFGRRAYLRRWRAYFPGAGLDRVKEASHYLPEDAPEQMVQAVHSVAFKARQEAKSSRKYYRRCRLFRVGSRRKERHSMEARSRTGLLQSARCAVAGIVLLLKTQRNARIHAAATVAVLVLGTWLPLSVGQWKWLALAIALVWIAEALNTAIEVLSDALVQGPDPAVGRAKDAAAAGVLLAAGHAVVVGVLVFGPYLVRLML